MTTMTAPIGTQPGFVNTPTGINPNSFNGLPGVSTNQFGHPFANPYTNAYGTPWFGALPVGSVPTMLNFGTAPAGTTIGFNPQSIAGQCIGNAGLPYGGFVPGVQGFNQTPYSTGTINEFITNGTTGWVNTPYGPVPVSQYTQPFNGSFTNWNGASNWPTPLGSATGFGTLLGWNTPTFQNSNQGFVNGYPVHGCNNGFNQGFSGGTPFGWNTTLYANTLGSYGSSNGPIGGVYGGLSSLNTPTGYLPFTVPFNSFNGFSTLNPFNIGTPFLGMNYGFGAAGYGGTVSPWINATPWWNWGSVGTIPTFGGLPGQTIPFGWNTPGYAPGYLTPTLVQNVPFNYVPNFIPNFAPAFPTNFIPTFNTGFVPGAVNVPGAMPTVAHGGNGVPGFVNPGVATPTENIERTGKRGVNMGREAA